ncbi:MAG: glycosyltransferase family 2 protein [Anaerolineae bacterium]|nr:glycosyltransferase family 2 protein [Anaerolineae bacterium]MDW8069514.1 glycosyltransferase family 2 protein [Anaerolineae bacterium]
MPDLSVLIVNWNVRDLLRRCLHSILASLPIGALEIIVVDNGSTDGSAEMVRAEFPQVHLIANTDNRGFTRANNQGLAVARGRYILLLNPDTEVVGDALETMITFADAHPNVGIVGPQLLNPDGTVQSSRRRFPTLGTALFESTWLQPYAPRRLLMHYYVLDRPDHEIQDVDWVTGAALMARREAVEQVGPLDEGFFMYSEELDWCRRFREAGWRVVYLPTAQVIHHEGKSSEQALPARHIHFQTSKVRYFRKYHGPVAAETLRAVLLGNYLWQIGLEGAKWLLGHQRPLRAARIGAYRQVVQALIRGLGAYAHRAGNRRISS